ncbi:MAG: LAGLIDADG family homing endonuclease, partial [Candidatus Micrarchaeota archaeon]
RTKGENGFHPATAQNFEGDAEEIRWGKSELHVPAKIAVSQSLCRLLGYYASEGHFSDCVALTFGPHEQEYASDAARCAKECFGVRSSTQKASHFIRVTFGGKLLQSIFEKIFECGRGAENKRVPWLVFNAPADCKKEFLRGYFRGDGQLSYSERGCRLSAVTVSRKLASDIILVLRQLNAWPSIYERPLKPREKQAYVVSISDKQALRELSDTAMDLAKGDRDAVWDYLQKPVAKQNVRRTVPVEVLRAVQESIYKTTRRGTAHFVGNYKRVSFGKLKELFELVSSKPKTVLLKDRVLNALSENESVSTSEAAGKAGVKFITAFKALKKLAAKGVVKGTRVKGDWLWNRFDSTPCISEEALRRLLVAKNIVDNELVLLRLKKIKRVPASSGMVYDVEVTPTHSFVTGLGGLLVSNTDADPYGFYIYSTMKYGSMALAHESERLGCPKLKFLGMSISDIEHYDLRAVTIKAKEVDIKRAQELLEYDWFKTKEWQRELKMFLEKKMKAEIQALSSKNLQYISKTYLPEKIKNQDFLP